MVHTVPRRKVIHELESHYCLIECKHKGGHRECDNALTSLPVSVCLCLSVYMSGVCLWLWLSNKNPSDFLLLPPILLLFSIPYHSHPSCFLLLSVSPALLLQFSHSRVSTAASTGYRSRKTSPLLTRPPPPLRKT